MNGKKLVLYLGHLSLCSFITVSMIFTIGVLGEPRYLEAYIPVLIIWAWRAIIISVLVWILCLPFLFWMKTKIRGAIYIFTVVVVSVIATFSLPVSSRIIPPPTFLLGFLEFQENEREETATIADDASSSSESTQGRSEFPDEL